tara:strand:- start:195 stop:428 length:234 start_codon:yes stop_codon:yes gene_type:complete
MELTPLEASIVNAHELAAGLALSAMVDNLVKENLEAADQALDEALSLSARAQAQKEEENTSNLLAIVALTGQLAVRA